MYIVYFDFGSRGYEGNRYGHTHITVSTLDKLTWGKYHKMLLLANYAVAKNDQDQWYWFKNRATGMPSVLTESELEDFAVQRLSSVPL